MTSTDWTLALPDMWSEKHGQAVLHCHHRMDTRALVELSVVALQGRARHERVHLPADARIWVFVHDMRQPVPVEVGREVQSALQPLVQRTLFGSRHVLADELRRSLRGV